MDKHTITKVEGKYFLNTNGEQGEALTVKQPSGWDPTIFLPETMVAMYNRKLINTITLDKKLAQGEFVLTVKAPSAPPTRTGGGSRAPKKADVEFLSEEEAEQFKALMDKIQQARKEAAKPVPLTPIEKARRAKERAEAALEALLKEAQEQEQPQEEAPSKKAPKGKK